MSIEKQFANNENNRLRGIYEASAKRAKSARDKTFSQMYAYLEGSSDVGPDAAQIGATETLEAEASADLKAVFNHVRQVLAK
jgi:hypothetical protein